MKGKLRKRRRRPPGHPDPGLHLTCHHTAGCSTMKMEWKKHRELATTGERRLCLCFALLGQLVSSGLHCLGTYLSVTYRTTVLLSVYSSVFKILIVKMTTRGLLALSFLSASRAVLE